MLRLFLMRHAEAVQGNNDRMRPLSSRGRAQAVSIGRELHKLSLAPEYAICSPAKRTSETYDVLAEFIPQTGLIYPEYMYNAAVETLFEEISHFSDTYRSVLMVGHNPGIHELSRLLVEHGSSYDLGRLAGSFLPSMLAVIECKAERWSEIAPRGHTLTHLLSPI
jgi:phosphohistidine phosphatase